MGLIRDFCQPAYEAWLCEAVAIGRIKAPGYFENDAIRAAWSKAQWQGSTMGSVDPKKEAEAAVIKINASLSTAEREAAEINGSDVFENMAQRQREFNNEPVRKVKAAPIQPQKGANNNA
jgi:capsid protein